MSVAPSHLPADDGSTDSHSPSDEECERCVVCLTWSARPSRGGVSCSRCQDEFYCGDKHRTQHLAAHKKVCFQPKGLQAPAGVCAVCGRKGSLCARCGLASYCSKAHQKQDWSRHKLSCKRAEEETPGENDDGPALGLTALPKELLLAVCALLGPYDLVRLGQVSRALRSVARDPAAWQHVTFPERKPEADAALDHAGHSVLHMLHLERTTTSALGRDAGYGVLRVAPALGTLRIIHGWPPVNLLRFTRRVRTLELQWTEISGQAQIGDGFGAERLRRVLSHYRGHLQVLRLARIDDVATLHFIDGLGLRELRLGECVVRTYGAEGSVQGVATLSVGSNVTEEVVLELLKPCVDTLTTFEVKSRLLDFCGWAFREPQEALLPALRRCPRLVSVDVPADWFVRGYLGDLSGLDTLKLIDLGTQKHADVERALAAFPLARNIKVLTASLAFMAHRGLVMMVADAFPRLQALCLAFDSDSDDPTMDAITNGMGEALPDAPRDLAAILDQRLPDLEVLWLSEVRVPSTVWAGLASGLLPKLRELQLQEVQLTPQGAAALLALRAARPALCVQEHGVTAARRPQDDGVWNMFGEADDVDPFRCHEPVCAAPSDCEDEDPVTTEDEDSNDEDSSGGGINDDDISDEDSTFVDIDEDISDEDISDEDSSGDDSNDEDSIGEDSNGEDSDN
ncbi:uncharacterized protein LOC117644991 [Thrips palmi]|uniref:Uncharacterized protein LOC117644991 n=1 Tax=Thrips palmi TaxID=161013 RepID=A0A6P8Z2D7_THRPL|nr:uncharacterized protein LOC117644991 [Thrips palmi]